MTRENLPYRSFYGFFAVDHTSGFPFSYPSSIYSSRMTCWAWAVAVFSTLYPRRSPASEAQEPSAPSSGPLA